MNIINTPRWKIAPKAGNDLIEQLLLNRSIPKSSWDSFLHPDFGDLHDPFLLNDMDLAIDRLSRALKEDQKIGIFADYDADGIPGAALLKDFFDKIGLESFVYIPSRQQGYGLNIEGLDFLIENKVQLIITVDLGIRNIKEATYLKKKKIDLIITDHHVPGEIIPEALAIINPKRKDSKYPFNELSGGAVAFKLIQAFSLRTKKISDIALKWMIDLVGITTISDMVPLMDENRVFAFFGLKVLAKTKRIGLKKLYDVIGLDKENINAYNVGFQIGPRINAPGRLDHTTPSFELLTTSEETVAKVLAKKIDQINFTRQEKMEEVLKEVESRIKSRNLLDHKIIILRDRSWPSGINGLIAGKIAEKYHRPCIIFERKSDFSKGSARSGCDFNIVEALTELSDLLINFGGHAKAAGLSVADETFDLFYKRFLELAARKIPDKDLTPTIFIDAIIDDKDLTLKTFKQIQLLEPFGLGNPRPVFCLKNALISQLKTVGSGNHLKMKVNNIDAIYFNPKINLPSNNDKFDIIFTMDNNVWRGFEKIQLKIIQMVKSKL